MTLTLALRDLRDLLTDYETSPALNAAKYFEARQPYYASDLPFRKRIILADTARLIQAADPDNLIFYIQLKALPQSTLSLPDFKSWTPSAEYAVVWPATDWPKSTEFRMESSAAWAHQKEEHFAKRHEEDRVTRMSYKIQGKLPMLRDILVTMRALPEHQLKSFCETFEKALNIPIYEVPHTSPPSDQGPQEPDPQTPAPAAARPVKSQQGPEPADPSDQGARPSEQGLRHIDSRAA